MARNDGRVKSYLLELNCESCDFAKNGRADGLYADTNRSYSCCGLEFIPRYFAPMDLYVDAVRLTCRDLMSPIGNGVRTLMTVGKKKELYEKIVNAFTEKKNNDNL